MGDRDRDLAGRSRWNAGRSVAVGERVVVRRHLGPGETSHLYTDVIGHVVELEPELVVRRADGGADTLNIQVLRSPDLVHWTRAGDALPTRPAWAHATRSFWAPRSASRSCFSSCRARASAASSCCWARARWSACRACSAACRCRSVRAVRSVDERDSRCSASRCLIGGMKTLR